jgi:hypothetical protein
MRLGPYALLGEVGRGGMGVVHRARSPEHGDVVVKLLTKAGSADAVARFERERRLLATLGEAEGFVPLLDAGTAPQGPYLVMPFVTGGTLRDRLRRGPLAIADALAVGRSLAGAIGRAHALGIVHRDLKPENVLFTGGGRALVADLGLAKHFASDAPGASRSVALSRPDALLGTAGYMPPEQMNSASTVGPAADVFALGAILHECLTGEPAFPGASVLDVVTRVERCEPVAVRSLRKDAPPWLEAVVRRALDRDPGRRFEDGAALERALATGASRRARWPLALLPVAAVLAVLGALALRPWSPGPSGNPRAPAAAPQPPPAVDLATRVKRWKGARIPAAELASALHDFPGAGEELAAQAFTLGVSGRELSPEVQRAFGARGKLAHAVQAVTTLATALAEDEGRAQLRRMFETDLGAPPGPVPQALRDGWRTLTTDEQLARTYPALIAPIWSGLEALAVDELAHSTLRKGADATATLAGLSQALLRVLPLADFPPVLGGCLVLATHPTEDYAPKVAALEAGGLELERRNEPALAAILLSAAVHTAWQGVLASDSLLTLASKAHRLALASAERESDPGRRRDLLELACWDLLDGYMTAPPGTPRLAAFREALALARREGLEAGESLASRLLIEELVLSNQCARLDELVPAEKAEWLPELLCARAVVAHEGGADAKAREYLMRARALSEDRPRDPRLKQLIEVAQRSLDAKK